MDIRLSLYRNLTNFFGTLGILGSIVFIGAGLFGIFAGLALTPFTFGISTTAGIAGGSVLIATSIAGFGLSVGAINVKNKDIAIARQLRNASSSLVEAWLVEAANSISRTEPPPAGDIVKYSFYFYYPRKSYVQDSQK